MKKLTAKIFIAITLGFLLVQIHTPVIALECGDELPSDEQLNDYIANCKEKINDLQGQQATLAETIEYFTTEIYLTQAEINKTQQDLDKLGVEIEELSGKIESIDYSLDDLTELFVNRVQQSYKQNTDDAFLSLLNSDGFSDFFRRLEYIKKVRDHDREVMVALEKSRLDYDNQKTAKEEKQAQVEALQSQLQSQKNSLAQQKAAKDKLLEETRNDEKRYQALRQEALNRVASLARYASGRGGASILTGTTDCSDGWGCYYNQRDERWGNQLIGSSDATVASVGCLVTSAAMIASHYDRDLTPADIAASTNPFSLGTADMRFSWLGSVNGTQVSRSVNYCSGSGCFDIMDSELSAGKPVIVRITAPNVAGTHFIVITKKEGDNYIMKDPFEPDGNNIPFTQKHSIDTITRVDKVTVH